MTPKSLREGFELYKQGKPFGKPDDGPRHAMFGLVVDEIETLKESIGTQVSVADLLRRIEAMETTIGNALHFAPIPEAIIQKLAEAYAGAFPDVTLNDDFLKFDHDGNGTPGGSLPKAKRGRPRKDNGEAVNA